MCNNRGDCICGRCECYPRQNSDEVNLTKRKRTMFRSFSLPHLLMHSLLMSSIITLIIFTLSSLQVISGDFCECDNFSCDRYNGELCSGEDHGECVCGQCNCRPEWDVEGYSACECKASDETCITPFGNDIMKVCSGHGECACGECRCEENYSGKWCEECPTCPDKCEELKPCVQCQVFQSGELSRTEDDMGYICADKTRQPKCEFNSIVVPKAEDMVNADERTCTFIDDDDCRFTFVYGYKNETGELQVRTSTDLTVNYP